MSATLHATPHRARRLLLTLGLGEMPDSIPSLRAVRRYGVAQATRIDGGPIDRLLRHHGSAMRCARLHNAREPASERPDVPGARRYDDIEQLSGVARVLAVEVTDDVGLPTLVKALAQVPEVESVRPDLICRTPFDRESRSAQPDLEQAWRAREQIRLARALGYEAGDPSVVVGVADTGVTESHSELVNGLRPGFDSVNLSADEVGDLELVGDNARRDEEPDDEVGHGTGCAGILRARGLLLPPGGAGACSITPVRVLGAALSGGLRVGVGALADIDVGMKRLIDLNVKVINMSFGTAESALTPEMPRPHAEVVRYALARGVVLIAASGNSGIVERYFPAASDGVIAVGAVDGHGAPSRFSTRGTHVALCAPGEDIWTCGREPAGDGYQCASGTSFAAPFVTATCALLIARAERRAWPLTPERVRRLLLESARPFTAGETAGCGRGVLDAFNALQRLDTYIDEALAADEGE